MMTPVSMTVDMITKPLEITWKDIIRRHLEGYRFRNQAIDLLELIFWQEIANLNELFLYEVMGVVLFS